MASKPSRQTVLLAVLAVLIVVVMFRLSEPTPTVPVARPRGTTGVQTPQSGPPAVPDVRLEALESSRPELAGGERNPFGMEPTPPPSSETEPETSPPGTPRAQPSDGDNPGGPSVPAPPPPPPPIPLKFIGVVQSPRGRVAVLSDGRSVFHGREGDIIEGRYRIVRIGEESIEMEHADGRGRQTIRLSGA